MEIQFIVSQCLHIVMANYNQPRDNKFPYAVLIMGQVCCGVLYWLTHSFSQLLQNDDHYSYFIFQ